MSVRYHRGGWETRWRDADGRERTRRFRSEDAARGFDEALAEVSPTARRSHTSRHGRGAGVYSYRTTESVRWRFVYRRSDGTQTSKRGFTSERAARDARRRLIERVERGEVRHTKETFGDYWERWLARRKPYLEPGTWTDYEIHGRTRLVPAFGSRSLGELSVDEIRDLVAELAEAVEASELAPKTVNNALGTLVVCLNAALEDGLIATNPALRVQRLLPAHIERDYLRLDEIPRYLDACSDVYRPLAAVLVGSGLRISEALGLRVADLELGKTGGTIVVYRARKKDVLGSTKSDRFRSVEIGPALWAVLRDQVARRAERVDPDNADSFLFVMPVRTETRSNGHCHELGSTTRRERAGFHRFESAAKLELYGQPARCIAAGGAAEQARPAVAVIDGWYGCCCSTPLQSRRAGGCFRGQSNGRAVPTSLRRLHAIPGRASHSLTTAWRRRPRCWARAGGLQPTWLSGLSKRSRIRVTRDRNMPR